MHCAHLTIHGYIGLHFHQAIFPPAPATVIAPHIAIDTLLGLTINAKYSKTVIGAFGFQLIGKGNDSGYVVPHLSLPPPNVLVPIHIAFGESKVMFTASTVKIDVDGAATNCAAACFPVVPISLNQACNDPCNAPTDLVICPNSVVVGMTWGDIVAGLVGMAVNSAVNFLTSKLGDKVAGGLMSSVGSKIAERMTREFTSELTERFGNELGQELGEAVVENTLERPLAKFAENFVGSAVGELTQNLSQNLTDPAIEGLGNVVDGRPYSSPTTTPSGETPGTSGSTPIHSAE